MQLIYSLEKRIYRLDAYSWNYYLKWIQRIIMLITKHLLEEWYKPSDDRKVKLYEKLKVILARIKAVSKSHK